MTARLEKAIRLLPPEKLEALTKYAEALADRAHARVTPHFRWAGALAEVKAMYTSVELQHKASEWRGDD